MHESLPVRRERADTCLRGVRDDQSGVELKEARYFLLIGLELMERLPDRRILHARAFQFDHAEWKSVDEHHHIGASLPLVLDDRELVDDEPVVLIRSIEVDQPNLIPGNRAVRTLELDVDP